MCVCLCVCERERVSVHVTIRNECIINNRELVYISVDDAIDIDIGLRVGLSALRSAQRKCRSIARSSRVQAINLDECWQLCKLVHAYVNHAVHMQVTRY